MSDRPQRRFTDQSRRARGRHRVRGFGVRVSARLGRARIHVRENWYRDVWLFLISLIVVIAVVRVQNTSDRGARTARDGNRTARLARVAAAKAQAAALNAHLLALAIQGERKKVIYGNCNSQNVRHDATLAALRKLDDQQLSTGPEDLVKLFGLIGIHVSNQQIRALIGFERTQTVTSYRSTKLLIDALVPRQDCTAVTAAATVVPPAASVGPSGSGHAQSGG